MNRETNYSPGLTWGQMLCRSSPDANNQSLAYSCSTQPLRRPYHSPTIFDREVGLDALFLRHSGPSNLDVLFNKFEELLGLLRPLVAFKLVKDLDFMFELVAHSRWKDDKLKKA